MFRIALCAVGCANLAFTELGPGFLGQVAELAARRFSRRRGPVLARPLDKLVVFLLFGLVGPTSLFVKQDGKLGFSGTPLVGLATFCLLLDLCNDPTPKLGVRPPRHVTLV